MTERCEFYRTEMGIQRNAEKHTGKFERPPQRVALRWCAAPEGSPVTRQDATGATTAVKLTCGGDLAKCQIVPKAG